MAINQELDRARGHADVYHGLKAKGRIGDIIHALRRLLVALGGKYADEDNTDVALVNRIAELAENGSIASGGKIWYATCSTAAGTGAKTATSSTGDFVLQTGAMVRLKCTTANTAANPTISIDGSTAKTIQPKSGTSGMAYRWRAQEVIDLVYDGSNFIMSLGPEADTSFYGITKLNSATNSTAENEAATPKAVKTVADAKVDRAGDTVTGPIVLNSTVAYIKQKTRDTSNYASVISFENETPSGFTYNPHFGFHNTGGSNSHPGVINLVPYGTNASPWSREDGLSISYDDIRFNNSIVRTGTVAVADGGTGATNAAGARANIGAVNIAGDTMTGNLVVTKSGDTYVEAVNSDTGCRIELDSTTGGASGVWSSGYNDGTYHPSTKWLIKRNTDGSVEVDGNCTGTAANVTGTVAIANGGTGATDAASALAALGGCPIVKTDISGNSSATFTISNSGRGVLVLIGAAVRGMYLVNATSSGGISYSSVLAATGATLDTSTNNRLTVSVTGYVSAAMLTISGTIGLV